MHNEAKNMSNTRNPGEQQGKFAYAVKIAVGYQQREPRPSVCFQLCVVQSKGL
jgi:hypothetical protein